MNTLIFLAAFRGGTTVAVDGYPVASVILLACGAAFLATAAWLLMRAPDVEYARNR